MLRFHRIPVAKPWAGSRLSRLFPALAADLPPGTGESIEVADLPGQSSVVAAGPCRDSTLAQLLSRRPQALLGELAPAVGFPLALKLLDTEQPLSVQVHPGDQPGRRGKAEAWLVLEAAPGAVVYQGLKPGVTAARFTAALPGGEPAALLNARPLQTGDYLFNPAGMVHALGGGLCLLELQQNCGVTLRLWDFPRAGAPRDMQVQEGLATARWDLPLPPVLHPAGDMTLQEQGPFGVRFVDLREPVQIRRHWPGFTLLTCIQGALELSARARDVLEPAVLQAGETVLAEAGFEAFELFPRGAARLVLTWANAP